LNSEIRGTAPERPLARRRERELVDAVLRKDRKATAEFVSLCADPLYSYFSRRLAPREDLVDDFVQDTFLYALRSLASFRGESRLTAWVLAIARHKVQDYYRQRLRAFEIPEECGADAASAENIESAAVRRQQQARVQQTLAALPEAYRIVLLWRYWEHWSTADIATEIHRSEKAVERLLAHARERFRKEYRE
jgi:RNA polymerase sigma-70 factor, ECF subfamily